MGGSFLAPFQGRQLVGTGTGPMRAEGLMVAISYLIAISDACPEVTPG